MVLVATSLGSTELVGYTGRDDGCSELVDNRVEILQVAAGSSDPLVTLVDTAFVGRLGPEALAALGELIARHASQLSEEAQILGDSALTLTKKIPSNLPNGKDVALGHAGFMGIVFSNGILCPL